MKQNKALVSSNDAGQSSNIVCADFEKQSVSTRIIKSISYDQKEIIADILKLHCPSGIDLDCTYSKGGFYKNAPYSEPTHKCDVAPLFDDVIQADARALPFENSCFKSVMFDPPFLSGKPKPKNIGIMRKRFSAFPSMGELLEFYSGALKEIYRVLESKGVLIFKCQDTTDSKQYLSHVHIVNEAEKLGFYPKDLFVLLAKYRPIAPNQRNQKHSRKFHSYFLVFVKK